MFLFSISHTHVISPLNILFIYRILSWTATWKFHLLLWGCADWEFLCNARNASFRCKRILYLGFQSRNGLCSKHFTVMNGKGSRCKNALKIINDSLQRRRLSRWDGYRADMAGRQVLRACLAVHLYPYNDPQILKYFFTRFRNKAAAVGLENSGRYFQLVLETNQRGALPFSLMLVPTSLDARLFFLAIGIVNLEWKSKSLRTGQMYSNDRLIGACLKRVTKVWLVLFVEASLSSLLNMGATFEYDDEVQGVFMVLEKCTEVLSSLWQKTLLSDVWLMLQGVDKVFNACLDIWPPWMKRCATSYICCSPGCTSPRSIMISTVMLKNGRSLTNMYCELKKCLLCSPIFQHLVSRCWKLSVQELWLSKLSRLMREMS